MSNLSLIKRANEETEYTIEQVLELKKCATDPVYFIESYVKIQHPKLGAIPLILFEYQKKCIKAFQENRWNILLASRQTGKTTIIAMYLLWFAAFQEDKQVLVASNKNGNAMEVMARIKFAYEELPMWLKPGIHYYTQHRMDFDNGSKIWSEATTANTGRGKSLSLILIDELAYVPARIQEAMWMSMAPTLSTGGSCIVSSTPNGDQELFSQLWREAKLDVNGFNSIEVQWDEMPRENQEEFKTMMVKKLGETLWLQEYENVFLSSDSLLVNTRILQMMKGIPPAYIDKGVKIWKDAQPGKTYMVGVDIAEGGGRDFSVIQVVELESMQQVMEFRSNKINETQLYNCLKFILTKICSTIDSIGRKPTVYWSFENNSIGAAISVLYQNDDKFPPDPEIISTDKKLGMNTSAKSKAVACKILKKLIEKKQGALKINSEQCVIELKNYIQSGAAYAAKTGATDDSIAAMLIVVRVIEFLSTQESSVFEKIYETEQDFYDENSDEFEEEPPAFIM